MARQRAKRRVTKKHLARAERERILRNWILGGTFTTILLVVGVIAYGLVDLRILRPRQPVAIVEGQEISRRDFHARLRLALAPGSDPNSIGEQILNDMIDELLIRQEADRLDVTITESDIERTIQEGFGYFPEGTPTLSPTQTLNPTELARETSTPMATPSPTVGPTSTPRPTSTPYTLEAFEENYNNFLQVLSDEYNVTEMDYRSYLETQLIRDRLRKNFESEVERIQEQVWLRHIRVAEREIADDILARLDAGESWDELAREFSEDDLTKDLGGDLGWLTQSRLLDLFGVAASSAFQVLISDIIGPLETGQGWHLIQVLDRGEHPLDDFEYSRAIQAAFDAWLSGKRASAEVVIMDDWDEDLPQPPPVNP